MARIEQFEDIEAWQNARQLAHDVYAVSNDGLFARDFGLRDQIRRASVSIMSNIAKGSAGEVRAQLCVASDQGFIDQERFQRLSGTAQQISRQLSALIKYLQGSENKGAKR